MAKRPDGWALAIIMGGLYITCGRSWKIKWGEQGKAKRHAWASRDLDSTLSRWGQTPTIFYFSVARAGTKIWERGFVFIFLRFIQKLDKEMIAIHKVFLQIILFFFFSIKIFLQFLLLSFVGYKKWLGVSQGQTQCNSLVLLIFNVITIIKATLLWPS